MAYNKEKELALTVCGTLLGFRPRKVDIIPLESDHSYGECTYVLFKLRDIRNTYYRASKTLMANDINDPYYLIKLTIERPTNELVIERTIKGEIWL